MAHILNVAAVLASFAVRLECDALVSTDGTAFALGEGDAMFFVCYQDGAAWRVLDAMHGDEIPALSAKLTARIGALPCAPSQATRAPSIPDLTPIRVALPAATIPPIRGNGSNTC